jgi:hypothetical protein
VTEKPDVFNNNRARFEAFHEAHPQVYAELKRLALAMKKRGFTSYSIVTLYGVARYRLSLESGEEYKLNNNHSPHYARLLMDREPELRGFFETREIRAA